VQGQVLDNDFSERAVNAQLSSQAVAYPNPATHGVFIRMIPASTGEIVLQDMTGKTWNKMQYTSADAVKFIDLSIVPAGMYICTLATSNGERQTIKVVIVKP
jgi:hypothetical protein